MKYLVMSWAYVAIIYHIGLLLAQSLCQGEILLTQDLRDTYSYSTEKGKGSLFFFSLRVFFWINDMV